MIIVTIINNAKLWYASLHSFQFVLVLRSSLTGEESLPGNTPQISGSVHWGNGFGEFSVVQSHSVWEWVGENLVSPVPRDAECCCGYPDGKQAMAWPLEEVPIQMNSLDRPTQKQMGTGEKAAMCHADCFHPDRWEYRGLARCNWMHCTVWREVRSQHGLISTII